MGSPAPGRTRDRGILSYGSAVLATGGGPASVTVGKSHFPGSKSAVSLPLCAAAAETGNVVCFASSRAGVAGVLGCTAVGRRNIAGVTAELTARLALDDLGQRTAAAGYGITIFALVHNFMLYWPDGGRLSWHRITALSVCIAAALAPRGIVQSAAAESTGNWRCCFTYFCCRWIGGRVRHSIGMAVRPRHWAAL